MNNPCEYIVAYAKEIENDCLYPKEALEKAYEHGKRDAFKKLTSEEMIQAGYEVVEENQYEVTVRMQWAMWQALLYKKPHKELSDEEIRKIYVKVWDGKPMDEVIVNFARAIIKASRGEE